MVAPAHADPFDQLHPDVIASDVYFAERQADLTGAYLNAMVVEARRRGDALDGQNIPQGFLLELGAIVQLRVWELSGMRPLLQDDVPTYQDAVANLCARVRTNPLQFRSLESATLSRRIMQLWLERFSWSAPTVFGIDITVGQVDEDTLIDALAQLLWKNRRNKLGAIT